MEWTFSVETETVILSFCCIIPVSVRARVICSHRWMTTNDSLNETSPGLKMDKLIKMIVR